LLDLSLGKQNIHVFYKHTELIFGEK